MELAGSASAGAYRYFAAHACVFAEEDRRSVFVGGTLVGSYDVRDKATRNAILIKLSEDPQVHIGKLVEAFELGREQLRNLQKRYEASGLAGVMEIKKGGRQRVVNPALRRQLYKLFDEGVSIRVAHAKIRGRVSQTMVGRTRKAWRMERDREASASDAVQTTDEGRRSAGQLELVVATTAVADSQPDAAPQSAAEQTVAEKEREHEQDQDQRERERAVRAQAVDVGEAAIDTSLPALNVETGAVNGRSLHSTAEVSSGAMIDTKRQYVQHAGSLIVLALLQASGLYRHAENLRRDAVDAGDADGRYLGATALRVALDAAIIAIVIGQRCIEGVRRVATPSANTLLRVQTAVPSESWVRGVLGRFAEARGQTLHLATCFALIDEASCEHEPRAWFYIDNHMRPYTGKRVLRKGWRMQDKRVLPGASDYWVHDQDGRPLLRINSPSHEHMTERLRPAARLLRDGLDRAGAERTKIALVFDRAGAFASEMAALRDAGIEFVTYERGPCAHLLTTEFDRELVVAGETIRFCEKRDKNLGRGRGRVRRINLLMEDSEQISIVCISDATAQELIVAMLARWALQENQFKYGVERLGINQLDGRRVDVVPDDEIIPNPARRRLLNALSIARRLEGEALRQLAQLPDGDKKRARWEHELARSRQQQLELEQQRPSLPKRIRVGDTELAGKLVRHRDNYKLVIDTLRIVLANVIADLAAALGPHLTRPAEAKKTLDNLLVAPAVVYATRTQILIDLAPAGTRRERAAFAEVLRPINARKLSLPGDPSRRPLRFKVQVEGDASL